MTFEARVAALDFLRLSPRDTRFLVTVALHGGFCLRRHYAAFARAAAGGTGQPLDRLVQRGLMTRARYRSNACFVYHLRAKRIYRVIAQQDNRNQRLSRPGLIARKLMLLDVVLSRPDVTWVATEQDKIAVFTERFGVPRSDLPHGPTAAATSRSFGHKWPIALTNEPNPRVQFIALILDSSGQSLRRFLQYHARLFAHLPAWTIVAATPKGRSGLGPARAVFDQMFGPSPRTPAAHVAPLTTDLARYFDTRRALEDGRLSHVSIADLDHYREARTRHLGPSVEETYRRWRAGPPVPRATGGTFEACVLPFTYRQFGDFAGES